MLRKVKFDNFYSFKEEQEIDFLTHKKKTYDYYNSKSNNQITKVMGVVGGNASGKTNVMRLFSFLSYFACSSSKEDNHDIIFKTFFNNKDVSNFFVEFEVDSYIFFYEFSIKGDVIVSEKLSLKEMVKGAHKKDIFVRNLNVIDQMSEEFFVDFPKNSLKNMRPDVSLVAYIKSNYKVEIINQVYDYFSMFKSNINEKGEINNYEQQVRVLSLYYKDNDLRKRMNEFIRRFDIGLNELSIVEEETKKEGTLVHIKGSHKVKTKNEKLDFNYESRGTQSLFFTLANILSALKNNHIVIIDEIESGLHPEALNKIISYFIDENENGKAQLLFSSHSLGFMNKLDIYQTYLVEKNDDCESLVYRLSQVKNIRTDDNHLAKYMSGVYGAFPKIRV